VPGQRFLRAMQVHFSVEGAGRHLLPEVRGLGLWRDLTMWKLFIKEYAGEELRGEGLFKWVLDLWTLMAELGVEPYEARCLAVKLARSRGLGREYLQELFNCMDKLEAMQGR
jgi:hypothetical protein